MTDTDIDVLREAPGQTITAVRAGRNWIRVGDRVKAKPRRGRAYETKVVRWYEEGTAVYAEVVNPRTGGLYLIPLTDITRLAQTRGGEKIEKRSA